MADAALGSADSDALALKRSEARYRAVVEDQTELICRFLADGTYTFVNDAYCRYFDRSRDELLGRSFWEFIPNEWHAEARALLGSITPDNPVAEIEHEVIAPNGEIRWQQWRDRGFFDDHRILIVDDNVDYVQTLAEVLRLRGHDVYAVHDGPSAIDATAQMTPDVVLLDLGLPGMDGVQVAQLLRGECRCTDTLMVAVTGYGRHQDSTLLAQAGFDHHLVKPVDIAVIEALIAGG